MEWELIKTALHNETRKPTHNHFAIAVAQAIWRPNSIPFGLCSHAAPRHALSKISTVMLACSCVKHGGFELLLSTQTNIAASEYCWWAESTFEQSCEHCMNKKPLHLWLVRPITKTECIQHEYFAKGNLQKVALHDIKIVGQRVQECLEQSDFYSFTHVQTSYLLPNPYVEPFGTVIVERLWPC